MSDEHKQYASTSAATLEAHILSVHSAKSEAEWWAQREIERLRAENEKLRTALKPFSGMVQYCEGMSDSESHCVLVGDLRAAAAALKETGDE